MELEHYADLIRGIEKKKEQVKNTPTYGYKSESDRTLPPLPPSRYPRGTYSALLKKACEEWKDLSKNLRNFRKDRYTSCSKGFLAVVKLPVDTAPDFTSNTKDLIAITAQVVADKQSYFLSTELSVPYSDSDGKIRGKDIDLTLPITDYEPSLEPAFDYLTRKSLEVYMVGRVAVPYDFVVFDIYIKPGHHYGVPEYAEVDPEQPVFKLILDYLLTGSTKSVEKRFFENDFTSVAEYSMVSEFFSYYYPEGINKAIRRNLQIVTSNSSASDEQKQAKKALRILTNIDWRAKPLCIPDLQLVRKKLDSEFYGLEQVKEQILEAMAMIKTSAKMPQWGILLQGSPGTGKTAIATFVSKLFGCPSTQIDMNAIADQEALTGSSRLYDNGTIGLLVKKIYSVRSASQVLVLNEIDKGDCSGCSDALLSFIDHYGYQDAFIEDPIPTENIFFLATCNDIEKVSKPLLDRFVVISVPPYSAEEKKVIFERYILPRMLREQGLGDKTIAVSKNVTLSIYEKYFHEPGVRDLERFALRLIGRYCLMNINAPKEYSEAEILALLGHSHVPHRVVPQRPGLIWTAIKYNGTTQLIPIEAAVMQGTGKFEIVDIASHIVRGYCQSAYKCLQYKTAIDLSGVDIAISIPQAVPELVCNSVGMAVFAAILSAITGTTAFADTAFIGGCDLHGNTYLDDADIAPYLSCCYAKGIKTVYMPYGGKIAIEQVGFDGLKLVEAVDMKTLMAFAGNIGAGQ